MNALDLNQWLWIAAGGFVLLGILSAVASHRRHRRRDIDRPGLVPWQLVEILSFFLALAAAVLAVKL
ncbi:MAG: hypothetical protein JWO81_2743 [Alphaproteobacteria bacterium]|nr:hypothetical protein [Alphaproteobacteria bacterium]